MFSQFWSKGDTNQNQGFAQPIQSTRGHQRCLFQQLRERQQ